MGIWSSIVWLTCIVAVFVGGCTDSHSARSVREDASPRIVLSDVTREVGLETYRHESGGMGLKWMPEIVGPGAAFFDYDNDRDPDILLVGGGRLVANGADAIRAVWLYRNEGDGTFRDVTDAVGLGAIGGYGMGIAAADYDNDGDQDFLLTTVSRNLLFRNEGGSFIEYGVEAGLDDESVWSTSAVFFDADRDGWLDLFVANYVDWSPRTDIPCLYEGQRSYCTPQNYRGVRSTFYRNNGDGSFRNTTVEAGFSDGVDASIDKALGVVELDLENDGWPDLYVANDTERNFLYRNNGDGSFSEEAVRAGVAFDHNGQPRAGMGVDAGVVDSSGAPTIFVGNFTQETVGVFARGVDGYFADRAMTSRIGFPTLNTLTFGLFLVDLDLDTDLDVFLANGHVQEHIGEVLEGSSFEQPVQIFLNRGDGMFDSPSDRDSIPTRSLVARGAAYADYDADGDLDVLLVENDGPAYLWRNDAQGVRYLRVHLAGNQSNADGIGARIVAKVDGLKMERRVRTGSSFLSQSELTATFGLGPHERVDSLIVYWPSGSVDRFVDVEANQALYIREKSSTLSSS